MKYSVDPPQCQISVTFIEWYMRCSVWTGIGTTPCDVFTLIILCTEHITTDRKIHRDITNPVIVHRVTISFTYTADRSTKQHTTVAAISQEFPYYMTLTTKKGILTSEYELQVICHFGDTSHSRRPLPIINLNKIL
jgi:hypothetical protein